ncbi:ornithine cyclodeaminase family protein [Microbacterium capsulatum]|uniref:Ornithine cyclodeaminase family protein n=1 Tax=Microbacterium capsulatum TaxID=3041921 RepID=A0ABU0XDR2_9MICO|nr:ornithine cyclodeaminase family protein [Microbacterium sp. ASV81]MDQ4213252.1 ornithine cyclodeaminase family protein [Microbacterium sp. ASV81]
MPDVIADLTLISAADLAARVGMPAAIGAIRDVLADGFDPEQDLPRTILDVPRGQLLLMPAAFGGLVGQKLASVAPDNPAQGLERIQAVYVLLDGETLAPTAVLDGTALTSLRTPAVSAAAIDAVASPDAGDLVVFGSGPQAVRHVEAFAAIRALRSVRIVGRDRGRAAAAAEQARVFAPDADVAAGSPADLARADLVVCATTASEPLFTSAEVRADAAIVAVGSHEPQKAELPAELLSRSQVIVESRRVALSEAGDVIRAVEAGALNPTSLVTMHELFTGRVSPATDRPRIVKTCGMGWQDLAVAARAV